MPQTDHAPNILEVLEGIQFPTSVPEMVAYAEDQEASEEVLDLLQGMPEREYTSLQDVSRSLGQVEELPGAENLWPSASEQELDELDAGEDAADEQLSIVSQVS